MTFALRKSIAVFSLHIRCENCLRESERSIEAPAVDGVPMGIDELLESGFLASIPYCCGYCESLIGRLFGVSIPGGKLCSLEM